MPPDDDNVSNRFGPKRFLERGSKEAKKAKAYKRAPKQEREAAAKLGGRLTPASGAKFQKGDVKVPNLARIECKCTGADSFRVTREMLDKIEAAGLANDEIPFIEIEFLNERIGSAKRVAVLTSAALNTVLNRLKDAESGVAGTDESPARRLGGRLERNYRRRSTFNK